MTLAVLARRIYDNTEDIIDQEIGETIAISKATRYLLQTKSPLTDIQIGECINKLYAKRTRGTIEF